MRKHNSTEFRATSLTYSSPAIGTTSTPPAFFYNAFPDLNDVVPDGSQSAFPRRAKYILPLDSMFIPSAMWVDSNNIDEDYLASLDSTMREAIVAVIDRIEHQNLKLRSPLRLPLRLPQKPELTKAFYLEGMSEIPHKRLAATEYKWVLRTYYLASFYTTLENHLVRGQKIDVPLIPLHNPRASRLQRHWKAVKDAFKPTQLIDEAVALLVSVTLLPSVGVQAQEKAWMGEEEAENPGFIDFYQKLRDEFNPESCTTGTDRNALAERIIEYATGALYAKTGALYAKTLKDVSLDIKLCSELPKKNLLISWPSLFGEEVHCGVPQLCVRKKDVVRGRAVARISIPEAMQWFLALFSFVEEEERNFTLKDTTSTDYVAFFLESGENIACPRIGFANFRELLSLAHLYIKKVDGSKIDWNPNRAPADKLIADSICRYTILLESIRQQLCTGIGLR
jgi:hypothetical protein